jgi:metallo-beta-lactamase family protein
VRAEVVRLSGFSGHTDQNGLLDWISHFGNSPQQVFLTHGDLDAAETLSKLITERCGLGVTIPEFHQTVDLDTYS